MAHEVQLDGSFYERLRASMNSTGGVLAMAGTTYRHYFNLIDGSGSKQSLKIAARVKSLKALLSGILLWLNSFFNLSNAFRMSSLLLLICND